MLRHLGVERLTNGGEAAELGDDVRVDELPHHASPIGEAGGVDQRGIGGHVGHCSGTGRVEPSGQFLEE
jgi:hypothetical protein